MLVMGVLIHLVWAFVPATDVKVTVLLGVAVTNAVLVLALSHPPTKQAA
jgi:hypothetical protein